jgi:AcrR family transcriptional regulator
VGKLVPEPPGRARLLDSLTELCYEVGYRQLTLAALLERAGVTSTVFHRYFSDLEDCFCAAYVRPRDELIDQIEAAIADKPAWRDRIRATAYVMVRFLARDPGVTHLVSIEVRAVGERATLLVTEAMRYFYDLIDEGRDQRADSSISRATAESVGGGIWGQIYSAIDQGAPLTEEAVPNLLYSAVLPYLGPEAAAEELRIPPPPL